MTHDLILHIGGNKTGSTAIQHFLWQNRDAMRRVGYLIPGLELDWTSIVTGAHVGSLQNHLTQPDAKARITAVFEHLFASRPEQASILISAENLSNSGNATPFADVCNRFRTKVVLYIRRQDDLLASSWQQWYSKREIDLNAWLGRALKTIGHWQNVIKGWEEVAGPDSVVVRIYDRDEFRDGNIAKDFLDAIAVPTEADAFNFSSDILNPTYREFITPLVAGNKNIFQDAHDDRFYQIIGDLTGDSYVGGKPYSIFSQSQRDEIIAYYEKENQELCSKYFPDRERLFKPVDHKNYIYAEATDIQKEQLRFLTHMVFELTKRIHSLEASTAAANLTASTSQSEPEIDAKPAKGHHWWGK